MYEISLGEYEKRNLLADRGDVINRWTRHFQEPNEEIIQQKLDLDRTLENET